MACQDKFWLRKAHLLTYSIQKFQAMAVMKNMPAAAALDTANQALAPSLCMAGPAICKDGVQTSSMLRVARLRAVNEDNRSYQRQGCQSAEECRTQQTIGHTLDHCPSDLAICRAASELGSFGRSLQDRGSDDSAGREHEADVQSIYLLYVTARPLTSSKPHRLVCEVLRLTTVGFTTI